MAEAKVFISYIHENIEIVDRLATALREARITVWLDRDDILPGQWWKNAITEAIQQGAFFIACFSKELSEKQETYMHGELRQALDRLKNIPKNRVWFIPVLLNETEFPAHDISDRETLRDIKAVALYADWDQGIADILRAMKLEDPDHRRIMHLIDLILYHPPERLYAIQRLAQRDHLPPEVVASLIKTLRDTDFEVRWHAGNILQKIGPAANAAVPALAEALEDPDELVSRIALLALAKIGPKAAKVSRAIADRFNDRIPLDSGLIGLLLGSFGPAAAEAVPALAKALMTSGGDVFIASALGKIGSAAVEAVPALANALKHSDAGVRHSAAHALMEIGPAAAGAVAALTNALSDSEMPVRLGAALALGCIGPPSIEAIPALANALRDGHRFVRSAAARALGEIGSGTAEAALIKALNDPAENVRKTAADALTRIGSSAAT